LNKKETTTENQQSKTTEQTNTEPQTDIPKLTPLEQVQKEHAELKETLQRVYADFQNYKRRNEEDKQKYQNNMKKHPKNNIFFLWVRILLIISQI
jgi:molecular chaperone GrpE (heat shock protein)